MNSIRVYAKSVGHEIIGKLTRHPECEYIFDDCFNKVHSGFKMYMDEAGNEYHIKKGGVCIVTADGGVI